MRHILGLSVAFLAAGCTLRPWTPSVSVAFWAEDVPDLRETSLPTSAELGRAWQLPEDSAWGHYTKGTLASSVDPMGVTASLPDVRRLDVVRDAEEAATNVARGGLPEKTLWVIDLRGAASCAFAARLSQTAAEPIAPIITFNNWPAEDSVVPADETLAGLIAFQPKLPPAGTPGVPVLVLDSWRLAYRFDTPADDVYDNRYMLISGDLPDAATLKAQGIERVVYVVEDLDDAEVEEDDLNATFQVWQSAGLSMYLVDLPFLKETPPPKEGMWQAEWSRRLAEERYTVKSRYTLVDDPVFYGRARAGFGWSFGTHPLLHPGFRGGGGHGFGGGGRGFGGGGGG